MSFPEDQLFCLRWNNYQENIVEVFDKLLVEETFADVTLALDYGVNVRCHKMVLAACSTYFEGLFEELPCPHPIVVLKDITYREIKEVLEFMYTGEVQIAEDHFPQFVRVANVLQVKGLMAKSASLTISKIKPEKKQGTKTSTSTSSKAEPSLESNVVVAEKSSAPPPTSPSPPLGPRKFHKKHHQRPPPMWPMSPAGHDLPLDMATLQATLAHKHSIFSTHYDNTTHYDNSFETPSFTGSRKRKSLDSHRANRHHDTPILRNVLGQGHVENSMSHSHPDSHDYPSHSNDSANYNDDTRRSSMDTPNDQPSCGSYAYDTPIMEDDNRRPSPTTFSDKNAAGIANPVQSQRPGWKRYKQYTPVDVSNAIESVKRGMSALQAARKFSVPSRTLYDKVKKLGITTSRPFRRSSTCTSASFPDGIGCNVNGSIYGNISMIDNNNSSGLIDNSTASFETPTFTESRDEPRDQQALMEATRTSRSPYQPIPLYAHSQTSIERIPHQETTENIADEVQDLSINRRSEGTDEIPPNIQIKEEK